MTNSRVDRKSFGSDVWVRSNSGKDIRCSFILNIAPDMAILVVARLYLDLTSKAPKHLRRIGSLRVSLDNFDNTHLKSSAYRRICPAKNLPCELFTREQFPCRGNAGPGATDIFKPLPSPFEKLKLGKCGPLSFEIRGTCPFCPLASERPCIRYTTK